MKCSWCRVLRWSLAIVGFLLISAAIGGEASAASTGLDGRLIVGYQGWFGCPGDFQGNNQWQHWFANNIPDANHLTVDFLPYVGDLTAKDLCSTGLQRADGSPVLLFSSQNSTVVKAHFRWMQQHGIDGASVERFVGVLFDTPSKQRMDNVLQNVRAGAEAASRVFYISYDVSGANPQTVFADIRNDWRHLVNDLKLTSSPSYLQVNGKPVVQIWGFGFTDRPGTPAQVSALIRDLKSGSGGLQAATLIGGVPTAWRTLKEDSKTDPGWAGVYRSYDVISPWSVGRFADKAGVNAFITARVLPDLAETNRLHIGYMPVIFPGFSWYNLMENLGYPKYAILNQIPRSCGDFMWYQVYRLLGAKVRMAYAAMFDEVDEGTALFKTEAKSGMLPEGSEMVALDQDGCLLPNDWYLTVTGEAAKYLRQHRVPPQNLSDALVLQ